MPFYLDHLCTLSDNLYSIKMWICKMVELSDIYIYILKKESFVILINFDMYIFICVYFVYDSAQVLQVILSLYMHGEGCRRPLPQRDEVLLCSAHTNAEQVSLNYWDIQYKCPIRPPNYCSFFHTWLCHLFCWI